jgi:GT2 family glycosyltransferase
MTPDVSVIIPTFRRPRELAEAIASVLAQSGVGVQVLIVDDSPEGSARDAVESIGDRRVTYILNPNPTGGIPSIVRNLALSRAEAPLVHFLDDDDIVPSGHYERVIAAFSQHPDVGMVFGRIEPFGGASEQQIKEEQEFFATSARLGALCQRIGSKWAFVVCMMFVQTLLVCSAGIVRRDCAERVGGFDPRIRLMEDVDFYLRMIRNFGAFFLDHVALNYRISRVSLMHAPQLSEAEKAEITQGRTISLASYRADWGSIEYYAMKIAGRSIGRAIRSMGRTV